MKNLIILIVMMTFFVAFSTNLNATSSMHNATVEDSIHIWTSPDLYDIATTWVSAYEKINPDIKINVSSVPANMVAYKLDGSGNIGLITKSNLPVANSKNTWKMPVGRDIIVPVMNSENPFLEEILQKGISPDEFADVFTKTKDPTWGSLLNNDQLIAVNCYYISNESNKIYLSEFLQTDLNKISGKDIHDIDEMLKKIRNDKYSLGFCNLVDILDLDSNEIKEGLSFIPIDITNNNKVDHLENIYKNYNTLERGVWIGKYPRVLYSNIYTIAGDQPINSNELAFLKWVITEGQQYLHTKGYSELILSERQSKVKRLYTTQIPIVDIQKPVQTASPLFIVVLIISGIFIMFITLKSLKSMNFDVEEDNVSTPKVLIESSVISPNGIFFDKSHTWAFMEKDGYVRIGIADFLQHVLGLITKVKMKKPGELVKKGEPFLALIQHGKQLNIHSPVSGRIKEINVQLNTNSSIINSSPYSEGWVYVIESTNWLKEIKTFFMAETYKAWLKNEFSRLKNFFSSVVKLEVTNHLQLVIQDGGEMNDNPMEKFGPEVWEEFQTEFINRV
jgi:glycine cleavage system H lipoate-binding protein/ABC-type phosphate transport system substrate-binding protein